jgi:hypothetical protein
MIGSPVRFKPQPKFWSLTQAAQFELGENGGHAGRKNNQFVFELIYTSKVRMEALRDYLERNSCISSLAMAPHQRRFTMQDHSTTHDR